MNLLESRSNYPLGNSYLEYDETQYLKNEDVHWNKSMIFNENTESYEEDINENRE